MKVKIALVVVGLALLFGAGYVYLQTTTSPAKKANLGLVTETFGEQVENALSALRPSCNPVPLEIVPYEMRTTVTAGGTTTLPYFDESQSKCAVGRINRAIQERGDFYMCEEGDEQKSSDVWSGVEFNERGILSVRISHDTYCGGPYPDNGFEYLTFDLHTGEETPLQNLFADYKRDEKALNALFFDSYKKELSLHADGTDAGKENDEECKSVLESAAWNSYAVTKTGILIEPSLAHSVQACGLSTPVSFTELKPFLAPDSILQGRPTLQFSDDQKTVIILEEGLELRTISVDELPDGTFDGSSVPARELYVLQELSEEEEKAYIGPQNQVLFVARDTINSGSGYSTGRIFAYDRTTNEILLLEEYGYLHP